MLSNLSLWISLRLAAMRCFSLFVFICFCPSAAASVRLCLPLPIPRAPTSVCFYLSFCGPLFLYVSICLCMSPPVSICPYQCPCPSFTSLPAILAYLLSFCPRHPVTPPLLKNMFSDAFLPFKNNKQRPVSRKQRKTHAAKYSLVR